MKVYQGHKWTITPRETKSFRWRQIFSFLLVLIPVALYVALSDFWYWGNFWSPLFWTLGIGLTGAIFISVYNALAVYQEYSYSIDERNITITKGSKQKTYAWDEFQFFYRKPRSFGIQSAFSSISNPAGMQFLLQKKQFGRPGRHFLKTFVYTYSDSENGSLVYKILRKHIPEKPYKLFSDSGLVRFEFR